MYISYEEYSELYDGMDSMQFNHFSFDAFRVMDRHTTGVDNVRKLKSYFPTDESDAQAVKRCAAKIIHTMHQIQQAEATMASGRGYESTEHGMRGKVISSVSAGNESISYSTGGSAGESVIDLAVRDKHTRDKLISDIVREGLSGVADANGVNLLYMGPYPRRYLC